MQNQNSNQQADFLKEYYKNVHEKNEKILDSNDKTLWKMEKDRLQKTMKDHKSFLIALSLFKNSNKDTKDNSDIIIGITEELLLDETVELSDMELEYILCFMDIYSATKSSSSSMESNIFSIQKRANIFTRMRGEERLSISNQIISVMRGIIKTVKDTLSPIGEFTKKILDDFENRIKHYSEKIINVFHENISNLERTILTTRLFNKEIRIAETENFNEVFNTVFFDYIKTNLITN